MNKRAILVHCWTGYPEYCWYPYVKQELQKQGFEVTIPFFPDVFPLMSNWVEKIHHQIGFPNSQTVLIGHSLGSVAVLRYLESLPEGVRIGGAVLVSGFINDMGFRPLYNFFSNPLDFERIKKRADKFIIIASENDPFIQPYHTNILQTKLGASVIWKPDGGHFTQINRKQYIQFPEVVKAVNRIAKEHELVPQAAASGMLDQPLEAI